MPYTADNIEITISSGTAVIATDYGTSGSVGFSAAHAQISKMSWGDENYTYRVSEAYPTPVKIYGITGTTVPVSGTIAGTGEFLVKTNPTSSVIVKGSTFTSDAAVSISGRIQGITSGTSVGVTGYVNILNNVAVFGISGATAIAVTGGRRLASSTDSVTVVGNVGISGGLQILAATDSIAVYGPNGSTYVETNLNINGTPLGISGDALKVAVTNSGFTFSVTVSATTGVTNTQGPLQVQGYTGTGYPLTIKGSLAGGAVEIGALTAIPVEVTGPVEIDDAALIDEMDVLNSSINTVASNTRYTLDVLNLINSSGSGAKVNINTITRPSRIIAGQKVLSTTPALISTDTLRVGVTLKSLGTNTADIYIGNTLTVSDTSGYVLSPGESIYIEVASMGSIYARSAAGTPTISYIGS
jgi:hypothetical protein